MEHSYGSFGSGILDLNALLNVSTELKSLSVVWCVKARTKAWVWVCEGIEIFGFDDSQFDDLRFSDLRFEDLGFGDLKLQM